MGYRKKLKKIIKKNPETIKAFVAREALEHQNLSSFFNGVAKEGCRTGIVSSLIYVRQTHQFFDKYYEEINMLRLKYVQNFGLPLPLGDDMKHTLAWHAFEETAFQVRCDIDFEVF